MRGVLNRAARLLLTAGLLSLTRPAAAQGVLLPPIDTVSPPAGPIAMPRMLPPPTTVQSSQSPRPSQNALPSPALRATPKPRSASFATDQVRTPVDLLAVPTIPSSWAADTSKAAASTVRKAPEKRPTTLPVVATPKRAAGEGTGKEVPGLLNISSSAPQPAKAISQAPPLDSAPASLPDAVRKPTPKKAVVPWASQRQTAPAKANEWPAAFVEHEPQTAAPAKFVVKEAEKSEPPSAALKAPIITAAVLHQKAARACGGLARDVRIVVRPDQSFSVQIQPVNQSVERELVNRLLKIPEMTVPSVHLQVDLTP